MGSAGAASLSDRAAAHRLLSRLLGGQVVCISEMRSSLVEARTEAGG